MKVFWLLLIIIGLVMVGFGNYLSGIPAVFVGVIFLALLYWSRRFLDRDEPRHKWDD